MRKWSTIIFDMDGTLFDTETLSKRAWFATGEKFQLPVSEEFILKLIGLTPANAQKVYDAYMPKGWPQKEAYQFHEDFMFDYRIQNGIPTKGNLHKLLKALKKDGYQLGLATSARHENMIFNLEKANIMNYFDIALSAEMMEKGKPDPDIYFKVMQGLNVDPKECLIVEDSFNGVRSAFASYASVVMIPDMLQPNEEIKAMCDYIVGTLEDLLLLLIEEK